MPECDVNASKLEAFVASLPSRPTSALLSLLFADNRDLYVLVASDDASDVDDGFSAATRRMSEATSAIRAEIDLRFPSRHA